MGNEGKHADCLERMSTAGRPLTSCVSMGELPNLSVSQFPHLLTEDRNCFPLIGTVSGLNQVLYVRLRVNRYG